MLLKNERLLEHFKLLYTKRGSSRRYSDNNCNAVKNFKDKRTTTVQFSHAPERQAFHTARQTGAGISL